MGIPKEKEKKINKLVLTIMENYSDSVIFPLSLIRPPSSSAAAADEPVVAINGEKGETSRKRGRPWKSGTEQLHRSESFQYERDRRSKMGRMFAQLQSIVPSLIMMKASRERIVDESIHYIKDLEKKLKMLEDLKDSKKSVVGRFLIPCTNSNSSISITVSCNVAFFGIQSKAQPGLITKIFLVFDNHKAEILAANVSADHGQLTLSVTALVHVGDANSTAEKIKRDILSI